MRSSRADSGHARCLCACVLLTFLLLGVSCPSDPVETTDFELPLPNTPSATGACCLAQGQCTDSGDRAACDDAAGFWHGIGSTCAEVELCNSSGPFDDQCERARMADGLGPWSLNTRENRSGAEGTIARTAGCRRIWRDALACWTAPQDGDVVIETCSETSLVNTVLAVYQGCACPPTLERLLACNDDGQDCPNRQSQVTVSVNAGQSYLIHVGESFEEPAGGRVDVRARYVVPAPPGENANQNANSISNENNNGSASDNGNMNTNSSTAPGLVDLVVLVRAPGGQPVSGAFVIVSLLPSFEETCRGASGADGLVECMSMETGRQVNVFAGLEAPGGFLEANVQTIIVDHASGTMMIELVLAPA